MSDVLDEVRFWQMVMAMQGRTIFCAPDLESRIKGFVAARGLGGVYKVVATPACPEDRAFVVDEDALQASINQKLGRPDQA